MRKTMTLGLLLLAACASAEDVIAKYPDGTVQERYATDAKGERTGAYASFYQNGKAKEKGSYRHGLKIGTWTTLAEDGATASVEPYQDGKLNGLVVLYKNGKPHVKAKYAKGELTTPLGIFSAKGALERTLAYPLSRATFEARLGTLLAPASGELMADQPKLRAPYQAGKLSEPYRAQALHALEAVRMLAGAPWEDMKLDDAASDLVQHAAALAAAKGFSHTPSKPDDMDDGFFTAALAGTEAALEWSNTGNDGMVKSIASWVADPDAECHHRRFLLNPAFERVGVGYAPPQTLLNVQDSSREGSSWGVILWPGQGFFPQKLVAPGMAWSISLSPDLAQRSGLDMSRALMVQVQAHALDEDYEPSSEIAVTGVRMVKVEGGFPLPMTLLFTPAVQQSDIKRVMIEATIGSGAGQPFTLTYVVDCVPVALTAPSALLH